MCSHLCRWHMSVQASSTLWIWSLSWKELKIVQTQLSISGWWRDQAQRNLLNSGGPICAGFLQSFLLSLYPSLQTLAVLTTPNFHRKWVTGTFSVVSFSVTRTVMWSKMVRLFKKMANLNNIQYCIYIYSWNLKSGCWKWKKYIFIFCQLPNYISQQCAQIS